MIQTCGEYVLLTLCTVDLLINYRPFDVKRNTKTVQKLRSLLHVLQLEVGRAEFVSSYKSRCFFSDMMVPRPTIAFLLFREKSI